MLRNRMVSFARLAVIGFLVAGFARANEVLFIGNSFTFGATVPGLSECGGVPAMVAVIAQAKGITIHPRSLTSPGKDWSWHLAQPNTRRALERSWDWLVLQDYSTRPTRMGNVARFMQDGVTFSNRLAKKSPRAGIVLFETWARPPGIFYGTSGGRRFSGPDDMMADLHRSYAALAIKLTALNPDRPVFVAPVGTAFARCRAEYPAINLDAQDQHHASEQGYYLAALVLFEALCHQSATAAPATFFDGVVRISAEEAMHLQHVADEVEAQLSSSVESRACGSGRAATQPPRSSPTAPRSAVPRAGP